MAREYPAIFHPTCLPSLQHNVTAISVREDFADLEQQIMPFLQDMPRAQVGGLLVGGGVDGGACLGWG